MKEKIYNSKQVLVATIFGGPLGGLYALHRNLAAADRFSELVFFVLFGWLPVFSYLLALPYLPIDLALGFMPLACVALYVVARRVRTEAQLVGRAMLYEYYKSMDVARISVAALFATFFVEFAWITLLSDFA